MATSFISPRNSGGLPGEPGDDRGTGTAFALPEQALHASPGRRTRCPMGRPAPIDPVPAQYSHLGFPRAVFRRYRAPGSVPARSTQLRRARRTRGARSATTRHERRRPRSPAAGAASPTAAPIWVRSRCVVRARAGTCAMVSANEDPLAVVFPASPASLVPPHDDSFLTVGDVLSVRWSPGPSPRSRHHSARRARRRRCSAVTGDHPAPSARVLQLDRGHRAAGTTMSYSNTSPWFPSSVRKRCNSQTSEGQGPPHATTRL